MNELTVKEYAAVERVTERTVRSWISKGAIPVRRTPGGHLRISSPRVVVLSLSTGDGMKKYETA